MSSRGATTVAALALGLYATGAAAVPPGPELDWILHCQGCHGADGRGASHRVPSLRDSVAPLMQLEAGRDFLMRVPGAANSSLSDEALAGVLNWLVGEFGAGLPADAHRFTRDEVAAARRRPMLAVRRTREDVAARLVAAGLARPEDY